MYVVREVVQCKPGKVGALIKKFKALSSIVQGLGYPPFRLLTDVSGEPFWTAVAETEMESVDQFFEMEEKVMAREDARQVMAGYHDLVERGRREILKVAD